MKYILLLLLVGCGVSLEERKELINISEDYCRCEGGVRKARISMDLGGAEAFVVCVGNAMPAYISLNTYVTKRTCK